MLGGGGGAVETGLATGLVEAGVVREAGVLCPGFEVVLWLQPAAASVSAMTASGAYFMISRLLRRSDSRERALHNSKIAPGVAAQEAGSMGVAEFRGKPNGGAGVSPAQDGRAGRPPHQRASNPAQG